MLGLRLPKELEQRLQNLADKTHRTKTFYARKAIEDFLDEQEEYLLALATYERVKAGQEKTYSLEDVHKELDPKDA